MFEKLKYLGIQKVLNQLNQFKNVSADGTVGEAMYTKICLEKILSILADQHEDRSACTVLDGGCGSGTMTVGLAEAGYSMTGIEIHKPSLSMAEVRAKESGVSVEWISGDLLPSLRALPSQKFNAVICMGVLYTCAEYKEIIGEYSRVLKSSGVFVGTFRSKHYFVTTLLRQKQFEKALYVAQHSEGLLKLASVPSYYNWQTPKEIQQLFNEYGLDVFRLQPIGVFSGSGYDGLASVIDVDQLTSEEIHSGLYELESMEWDDSLGAGRFMMAVGRKSSSS